MVKLNRKLLSKLNSDTIRFQNNIINRLKLYVFAKSAIGYYCKDQKNKLVGYNFKDFKKKFEMVDFKRGKEIKSIHYKEIINVGNDFVENELADSIFVLNMSAFEHWLLTILKIKLLETPRDSFYHSDRKIDISIIVEVNDLCELRERVVDDYLLKFNYSNMRDKLKTFLKNFKINQSKITRNSIENINENSFCRNIIVHNQKKVNMIYINNCGKFARFKDGDIIKISEDILFEQGDNLLRFMQDFRKNVKL